MDLSDCGNMHGRRERIVRRLAEIDMVIGMDRRFGAERRAHQLIGAVGDDLVDIHVGASARTALQSIDYDVFIEHAFIQFAAGALYGIRFVRIAGSYAKCAIGQCAGQLYFSKGARQCYMNGTKCNGKVLDSPRCVNPVQLLLGENTLAEQVLFNAR